MNNIDPISKELIKKDNLIIVNNNNFDIYILLEWFLYNNDWIDPTTNMIFRYDNINDIVEYIIKNKKLFDFLTIENFKVFGVYNLSKLKYIFKDFKVFNKSYSSLEKKIINDRRILSNHIEKKQNLILKNKSTLKIDESISKKNSRIELNLNKSSELLNFYKKKYILKNN